MASAKETPNLDTTNQNLEYLSEEEEFKKTTECNRIFK
jgi:hypothetical protein